MAPCGQRVTHKPQPVHSSGRTINIRGVQGTSKLRQYFTHLAQVVLKVSWIARLGQDSTQVPQF